MTKTWLVNLLAALAVLLPAVQAHGPVNASEVETLIVKDELSDLFYTTGGYDLGEIYLGEAWVDGLGDGIYIHTILWGTYEDPLDRTWSATFRLETQDGKSVERTLSTTDGTTFESDFEVLEVEATEEEAELYKAFIAYDGTDIKRGSVITQLTAITHVGDEARDIAPGGILAPGSQGMAEVPIGDSSQVIDSFTLVGPTRYATARMERDADGLYVNVTSLLKQGDQHIHLRGDGLTVDETPFELKANGARRVPVEVNGAGELVLTTDIGGRTVVRIVESDGGLAAAHEDGSTFPLTAGESGAKDAPAPPAIALLGLLALLVLARRR